MPEEHRCKIPQHNIKKAIYDRRTGTIIHNCEKLTAFPQDWEQDKEAHIHDCNQQSIGSPGRGNRTRKNK